MTTTRAWRRILGRRTRGVSTAWQRRGSVLSLLLATAGMASAWQAHARDAAPSPWCDALLPVSAIADAVRQDTTGLSRRASGFIAENARRCSRIYSIGDNRFSDELIVLVTPARDAAAARADIARIIREARVENYFGLSHPASLGDAEVRFIRPDPLSGHRVEFNVSFAIGGQVFELKYQNVDDGRHNKFVQSIDEVVAIARGVAARAQR
jgi:hypothetical protein